jgi:hypothetical protein
LPAYRPSTTSGQAVGEEHEGTGHPFSWSCLVMFKSLSTRPKSKTPLLAHKPRAKWGHPAHLSVFPGWFIAELAKSQVNTRTYGLAFGEVGVVFDFADLLDVAFGVGGDFEHPLPGIDGIFFAEAVSSQIVFG